MNYLLNRKVQLIILVVLFAAVVWASRWGAPSMLQNLIAEVAGIGLGVWLTVTLVERMLERRRHQRWEEVRNQVFRAISAHIIDITLKYKIYVGTVDTSDYLDSLVDTLIDGRGKATVEAADAMAAAVETMRKEPLMYFLMDLFEKTEWHFSHLRDILTPRLIEFGEEPKLIQRLMDIDDYRMGWEHALIGPRISGHLEWVFDEAMATLEALLELYRYLAKG